MIEAYLAVSKSATSAKICVKKVNLAKICVKLSLKNGKKVVEYTGKCPLLLAEKPVYIKNAFWAKLCVTTIGIVHCRQIIDTLNHKDLPV